MTGRDRRALLLGGTAIGLALVLVRMVPSSFNALREVERALDQQLALLARSEAEVSQAEALQDSGAVIKARILALAPKILAGGGKSQAVVSLTDHLEAAASRHQVKLTRLDRVADSTTAGDLRRISVRAALEGDSKGTIELLAALGRGAPVLGLERLRISAPDPNSPPGVAELLRTEVTATGWYLAQGAAP